MLFLVSGFLRKGSGWLHGELAEPESDEVLGMTPWVDVVCRVPGEEGRGWKLVSDSGPGSLTACFK